MSFLLDTHTLLWSLFDPERLGKKAAVSIRNPDMAVLVSVVSFWEISLKYSIGRLDLGNVTPDNFPHLSVNRVLTSCRLPIQMRPPFTTCRARNTKIPLTV